MLVLIPATLDGLVDSAVTLKSISDFLCWARSWTFTAWCSGYRSNQAAADLIKSVGCGASSGCSAARLSLPLSPDFLKLITVGVCVRVLACVRVWTGSVYPSAAEQWMGAAVLWRHPVEPGGHRGRRKIITTGKIHRRVTALHLECFRLLPVCVQEQRCVKQFSQCEGLCGLTSGHCPIISTEYLDAVLTKTSDCTYQGRGLTSCTFNGMNEWNHLPHTAVVASEGILKCVVPTLPARWTVQHRTPLLHFLIFWARLNALANVYGSLVKKQDLSASPLPS